MYTWRYRVKLQGAGEIETTMSGYSDSECARALQSMYPGAWVICLGMC